MKKKIICTMAIWTMVLALSMLFPEDNSENSSYELSYSSKPKYDRYNKPPINCEKALTKEEAYRLRGTGYHGCRPNSSAECDELSAAQVKCKNCSYHSDNGSNSLCDYCMWVDQYGDE